MTALPLPQHSILTCLTELERAPIQSMKCQECGSARIHSESHASTASARV